MNRTYYTITLNSYLNHSNGESDLFVNNDITTDFVGLPIISGRAIKGLLRESMEETLERKGESSTNTIDSFFGKGGYDYSTKKLCFVSNAVVSDYEKTIEDLQEIGCNVNDVKSTYTKIVSQTKINQEGTAEEGSLRFTRVIDFLVQPQLHFYIDSMFDLENSDIFMSTLLNMRRMGITRNRGLGSVKIEMDSTKKMDKSTFQQLPIQNEVEVSIALKSPILLPKQIGDQNTTYSEDFIRGNILLGALAFHYLSIVNKVDDDFMDAFVLGGLVFDNLTKNGAKQLPIIIASEKSPNLPDLNKTKEPFNKSGGTKKKYVLRDFNSSRNSSEVTLQKASGLISTEGEFVETDKMFSFHISRNQNRLTGTSTQLEGAIFYYEYLVPFQEFYGAISETKQGLLKRIIDKLGSRVNLTLGASKSTQYGDVEIQFSVPKSDKKRTRFEPNSEVYLVLESPCLVYSSKGFPSVSIVDLNNSLPEGLLLEPQQAKSEFCQFFNGQWKCKTPKEITWGSGTTFLMKGDLNLTDLPSRLGEKMNMGLGKYSIYSQEEMDELVNQLNKNQLDNSPKSAVKEAKTEIGKRMIEQQYMLASRSSALKLAFNYVSRISRVPNSLMYTVKSNLEDQTKFVHWIKSIQGKIAEKTLKDANWMDEFLTIEKMSPEKFSAFRILWFEVIKQQLISNKVQDKEDEKKL